ncbi:MAG: hypothetical protein Q7K65_02225 [Candidatus Buchananbacteria bacterium]|nr:hypothetical protein [Candidatus Buchananbacteria bacterium]
MGFLWCSLIVVVFVAFAVLTFIAHLWNVYDCPSMVRKLTNLSLKMDGNDEYERLYAAKEWISEMRKSRILRGREQKVAEAERLVEQLDAKIKSEEKAREFDSSYLIVSSDKVGDSGEFFVLNLKNDYGHQVKAFSSSDLLVGSRVTLKPSMLYQAVPLSAE